MNTTLNKVIGIVATIALIVGVVAYNKAPKTIVGAQGPQGPKGESVRGPQGPAGKDGVTTVVTKLGAVASPDIPSPYISWGGVAEYRAFAALKTATTTPCAIQTPAATSTFSFASFKVTTGTSTDATIWTIATSTTAFATTTLVGTFSLPAGATGEFAATSGATLITAPLLPNSWVVFGVAGTKPAGSSTLLGTCSAGFRLI